MNQAIEAIQEQIKQAATKLDLLKVIEASILSSAEYNTFETREEADSKISSKLEDMAHNDCEGSYNCGEEEYTQEFIVDGIKYVGILTVEYNRYDKTYYYVDGSYYMSEQVE